MRVLSKCFEDDVLLRYLDQRLSDAEAQAVEGHVEGCPWCDQALARLADAAGTAPPDISPVEDAEHRTGGMPAGGPEPDAAQVAALLEAGGRYQVVGEVGRGGMGLVLRGRDLHLGRELAFKVLKKQYRGQEAIEQRFIREAQICSQLQHPAIVPVYEIGHLADGQPYFTMKLVEGETLTQRLDRRPSPAADLGRWLNVFVQVCLGVARAHSRGVLHRDLKPGNVMIGAFEEVQVMDWGMAKVRDLAEVRDAEAETVQLARTDDATQTGMQLGTLAYMAPEQARGEVSRLDARADVFGLGAILCKILTGAPPYTGDRQAVAEKAVAGDLADAWTRLERCGADAELVALAKRCLAADPADRPADARVVAEAVSGHLAGVQERLRRAELERAAAEAAAAEAQARQAAEAQARTAAEARAEEARAKERAEWRARRRAVVALVAVLLLVTTVGGGASWLSHRAALVAAKKHEIETAIAQDAPMARQLQKEGKTQEAEALLRRLEGLCQGFAEGTDLPRDQIDNLRDDLDFLRAADEASLEQLNLRDDGQYAFPGYAAAFRRYGIDVLSLPPAEAAERIGRRAIRDELLAVLWDWASMAEDPAERQRLMEVVQTADPDPGDFWNQWRAAVADADRARLIQLAAREEVKRLPLAVPQFATALSRVGAHGEALRLLREAHERNRGDFWLTHHLAMGLVQAEPPQIEEAVRLFTAAVALRPTSPGVYTNLGAALARKRDLFGAIRAFRVALDINPRSAIAHTNLGAALADNGDLSGAIRAYQAALAINPMEADTHYNLGNALHKKGDLPGAVGAYRAALAINPRDARAYTNLGAALADNGDLPGAIGAYRAALAINPKEALAHCNLGRALQKQGEFQAALGALQRGHELGSQQANWPYPSAQWVRETQQLIALDERLPAFLRGEATPADAAERLALADLCQRYKHLYAAATRFYADAFADRPDLKARHQYDAACAAVLAGTGQGKDGPLPDKLRDRLRDQARAWLQADLAVQRQRAGKDQPAERAAVQKTLTHWQQDPDLAGVRDADQLAKLPAAEQAAWRQFWKEVATLRKQVAANDR